LVITPGGVDLHVHLTPLPDPMAKRRPDDFQNGTRAAIRGGITTVGNMTHQVPGMGLLESLEVTRREASLNSMIDFVLHPVLNEPNDSALSDIRRLQTHGYPTLKLFMIFADFDRQFDKYLAAVAAAAESGVLVLMHCEDRSMILTEQDRLRALGEATTRSYAQSRPESSEIVAIDRALAMAESTGARMMLVHLASALGVARCRDAAARGVQVYVETRPIYLHFTDKVFDGPESAKFVGNPPPRSFANQELLWEGLSEGTIHTIGSDHAPWTLEDKLDSGGDLATALPGVPELETMLPMLLSEGVMKGRLTMGRFVEVTSTTPARIAGLRHKGEIRIGFDADLVAWDTRRTWIVDGSSMESRAGYSPYDGREVHGAPAMVLASGELVFESGAVADLSPGRGRMVELEFIGEIGNG
jgi:dihydropyrimidinase